MAIAGNTTRVQMQERNDRELRRENLKRSSVTPGFIKRKICDEISIMKKISYSNVPWKSID